MDFDLKITGGTVIDGTGQPRFRADVGVRDGRIVEVGACAGSARAQIDAEGALVTPGFTDIHTHYDGQVSWDDGLAPSSVHGVTTAVLGSCGVGFAPVRESDHERLIRLMEGVEDIPGTALAEGLTWNWESFADYMQAIDFPHAIDFCAQVPHDALRVYVMGDRGAAGEPASEQDILAMRAHVRAALEAGAAGFSTGRTDNHRTADGLNTPAAEASARELIGIAEAFRGVGHGVLQAVSDFDMAVSNARFDGEFDLIEQMAAAADGHPLSISLMQRDQAADQWKRIIARAEQANARGIPMRLQVAPRAIGVMLGLDATFHPFVGFPSYRKLADLPLAEQVAALRQPELRRQLLSESSMKLSGKDSSIPPLADLLLANLDQLAFRLHTLGKQPNYEPRLADSLGARAQQSGQPVLEVLLDALLADDGHALLYFPLYNYIDNNLDNVHTMLSHPLALPGLSDGGAHVGTVCDASFPTFLLSHWGRDRPQGRLPLEKLVKMQAFDTSRFIGLQDRGAVAVGQRADLNVIDFDKLRLLPPRLFADLPAGGKRFLQTAEGYRATLLGGVVIARDGKLTDARPGRLVRVGQP